MTRISNYAKLALGALFSLIATSCQKAPEPSAPDQNTLTAPEAAAPQQTDNTQTTPDTINAQPNPAQNPIEQTDEPAQPAAPDTTNTQKLAERAHEQFKIAIAHHTMSSPEIIEELSKNYDNTEEYSYMVCTKYGPGCNEHISTKYCRKDNKNSCLCFNKTDLNDCDHVKEESDRLKKIRENIKKANEWTEDYHKVDRFVSRNNGNYISLCPKSGNGDCKCARIEKHWSGRDQQFDQIDCQLIDTNFNKDTGIFSEEVKKNTKNANSLVLPTPPKKN